MTSGDPLPTALQEVQGSQTAPCVLVVDDVEANLVAMEALLSDLPCQIKLAKSGNIALRSLLKHEFAVMLLDVQMPEMDGYEVARYARSNPGTRDVPIIFLTAANNTEDNVMRGYGSGAVDFLFKPVTPTILRSKVRIFLELYASRRQMADAKTALERSNAELHDLAEARAALAEQFRTANEELKTAQSQLVQSAKMASLGELVAGVAHEINNPLAFVVSHLDTVKKNLTEVDMEVTGMLTDAACTRWAKANSRLREMSSGLGRITDLILKLRTFSRLDEGERKVVSVRECVESVLTILGHRLKKGVVVDLQLAEADVLDCFPSLLNQALMNVVANAIDAMQGEGTLVIQTRLEDDTYSFIVTDTGMGIPAELRERVLEPFFTTKPVGQGTGLGLSITYSIVQKHGGTLELRDPEHHAGTVVIIQLPYDAGGGT